METEKLASMVEVFEGLEDWRSAQQTRHVLSELLTVAVCAVLSGADDFEEVSQWGRERLDWLRGFLSLDYGVASPDTFERVFAVLDPKGFERAFRIWVGSVVPALGRDQVIAIDGKTSRRTTSKAAAAPLHMVSAFAANVGIVLGQTATAAKSNEITAIPELLRTLDVEDCIVTIDAMGTQTAIADQIRAGHGNYVLCVKDNHPKLLESILLAHIGIETPLVAVSTSETRSRSHGREEIRRCQAFEAGNRLYKTEQWRDLHSFAVVERTRTIGDRTTVERRHYITSLPPDAEKIAHAVRSHWEVENRLHWCLDVQFADDYARGRTGHVAHNLALVRHMALKLLRLNTSRKASIKTKRLLAATSDLYRAELLGFTTEEDEDDD
ncbi:MAG: ISAs1 family transposase [Rhodocyclaceae bacterium]|nr:ISAs1 family transposase [Rhodocyclaceae bacterium]